LAVVALGSALFQAGISLAVLIACQIAIGSGFHWPTLVVPLLIFPLCLFTLGLAWFLSALGVFVRDVGQIIPPIVTALLFLSPIFYPVSALPEWIHPVLSYSPIAYSVEAVRDATIFGRVPGLVSYLMALAGGLAVAVLGFAFFHKTRKGFADVL
jgi:lipopolysaccharide transport system permease protein